MADSIAGHRRRIRRRWAILVYERDDGTFGVIESPALTPTKQALDSEFKGYDLRATRARERGYFLGRDAVTDRDFVSSDEMETHPYYRLLARQGLKYFAGASISPDIRVNAAVSIQRSIDKAPYTDEELELVERFSRHVERSLRLSIRLLDAELSKLGLNDALNRLSIGVFALDSVGCVTFSNAAGERLLGDGMNLRDGQFRIEGTSSRGKIEEAIASCVRDDEQSLMVQAKPLMIERPESRRPLAAYVLPVRGARPEHAFLTHTRAILLLVDPEARGAPDPSLIRDLLGITLGEARVAALVGSGLAPREAAKRLGITEETARTTLKRVFAKVGVSRQSELAALLARLTLG